MQQPISRKQALAGGDQQSACDTGQIVRNKEEQRQDRRERLAAELRENLKKRKAQARARRDNATKSAPSADEA